MVRAVFFAGCSGTGGNREAIVLAVLLRLDFVPLE
jgi:hypothetical protein